MIICYLGLGSNLGDRQQNIRLALQRVGSLKNTKLVRISGIYETDPCNCPPGSPRFLNLTAKVKTNLSAEALLGELSGIEADLGRKNERKNSSRPIDLDILFYGNKIINSPRLKIPHPRLKERSFVLKPLKEIAPSLIKSLAKEAKVISHLEAIRKYAAKVKSSGKTIGFVPTMGYLHSGHLSLIKQAKKDCDICLVSIFVNPIQFGPREDYKKYPRDLEVDSILAKSAGGDCVFYPQAKDMYGLGYSTYVNVEKITDYLCGASRPGHFRGVATVVAKLFNIIRPDIAYFGQKDFQQALVIKKMVKDLNIPLKIKVMPIVRDSDGLALSSRNVYLSAEERSDALVLFRSLQKAREIILRGERKAGKIIAAMRNEISRKKSAGIDYIAIADAETLEPLEYVKQKALIALAVYFGKTRLIDNIIVG